MAANPLPPVEELRSLFLYDPETGRMKNKVSRPPRGAIGAFSEYTPKGAYRMVAIHGVRYRAHRVIWALHHGLDPGPLDIDHINGDQQDNRICNLRIASRSQNNHNTGAPKNNKSGVKGVSWDSRLKRWFACISINNKTKYLGIFKSIDEAAEAYQAALVSQAGEFART